MGEEGGGGAYDDDSIMTIIIDNDDEHWSPIINLVSNGFISLNVYTC